MRNIIRKSYTNLFCGLVLFLMLLISLGGCANASVPEGINTTGLVAAYDFVEGANPAAIYDISGNGHNAIQTNPPNNWTSEGLEFNGINNSFTIASLGNLTEHTIIIAQNEHTIEGSLGGLFNRYNSGAKVGFKIDKYTIQGSGEYRLWNAVYWDTNGTSDPVDNVQKIKQFHQRYSGWGVLCVRQDADTLTCGFDTRPGITMSVPNIADTQVYSFSLGTYGTYYYNGTIGYMLIYNRALSDDELEEAYMTIRDIMAQRSVSLPDARREFNPPYVVFTFDDSLESVYENAYRIAKEKGVVATTYTVGRFIGTDIGGVNHNTWDQLNQLRDANWGVEDHTYNHNLDITTMSDEELIEDMEDTDAIFTAHGLTPPEHMSYPGTVGDERTKNIIKEYRKTGRGYKKVTNADAYAIIEWDEPQYWENDSWYRIDQVSYTGSIFQPSFYAAVDRAALEGFSIIPYTHAVSTPDLATGCTEEVFSDILDYVLMKGFDPITIDGFYRAMQGIRTYPVNGNIMTGQTTDATYNKTVSQVGFVYGETRLPNPENLSPMNSGYDSAWVSLEDDYTQMNFTHTIYSLPPGKYYYRAAAKIDDVWKYGEELTYDPSLDLPYFGNELSFTSKPGSFVPLYSREIIEADVKIPLSVIPSADSVNVTVSTWTTNEKTWTESSNSSDISTSHVIGGFPANSYVQIYRDGEKYETVQSNSAGYISWTYSGGFSEHTFSAIQENDAILADSVINDVLGTFAFFAVGIMVFASVVIVGILKGGADPVEAAVSAITASIVLGIGAIIILAL